MLTFNEKNHCYSGKGIDWTGVTTFISQFKEPFDPIAKSEAAAVRKPTSSRPNPWYGLKPEEIREHWKRKSDISLETGHWFHQMKEDQAYTKGSGLVRGRMIPVIGVQMQDGVKVAPSQVLKEGIYPEHLCYMESAGLCGQGDIVTVCNGIVDIDDYKTSKTIEKKGWANYEGITKKMLKPLSNLDDCNFIHYTLQLSLYMYMVLRHNPRLKPGKMTIHHVIFDEGEEGRFKERNIKLDLDGNPIVLRVESIEVPYLKSHVMAMIEYKKKN